MRADRASIEVLHKTEFDTTGTARMSAAPELRVAPGETFKLEPGGMHVMLIDVESPLVEGETLPLRLKFYDGDDIIVDVPILAADARGPQE
ncbi:copper chaperone PCu(A)C [Octadecabacter sp. SW4]|uniref:copper chaperone PCu(A)C n=1 Tax=Octadecabacter sp. SW4 TaxID=2602067 RepID=UPI00155A5A1E|nr:copper chaperone PCu(A)C [Octadecabacter sp. SW4]